MGAKPSLFSSKISKGKQKRNATSRTTDDTNVQHDYEKSVRVSSSTHMTTKPTQRDVYANEVNPAPFGIPSSNISSTLFRPPNIFIYDVKDAMVVGNGRSMSDPHGLSPSADQIYPSRFDPPPTSTGAINSLHGSHHPSSDAPFHSHHTPSRTLGTIHLTIPVPVHVDRMPSAHKLRHESPASNITHQTSLLPVNSLFSSSPNLVLRNPSSASHHSSSGAHVPSSEHVPGCVISTPGGNACNPSHHYGEQQQEDHLLPHPSQSSSHFQPGANVLNNGIIINNTGHINDIATQAANARGDIRLFPLNNLHSLSLFSTSLLRALIVLNAIHTGEVHQDPLKCDPDTRQGIINDIVSWIRDALRKKGVLWLLGPAGIGQSAIAMSIAERLDEEGSVAKVVGSFFFWFGDPKRNNLNRFVVTIAYRLASTLKAIGRVIDSAIAEDQTVLEATLEVQWRRLVIEPVRAVVREAAIPPSVIIIDGLDECGTSADQRRLLNLILSCGGNFPIAFLIVSRPEPPLVDAFETEPLRSLCRDHLDLAKCKDHQEMRRFIRSSLTNIYHAHRNILQCYAIDGQRPTDTDVNVITQRADGQYVYPTTLLKYIDNDDENPHHRLQECLDQIPEALSPIDMLYFGILRRSHRPNNEELQDTLFLVCCVGLSNVTLECLSTLVHSNDEAQCRSALRRLHSIINISQERQGYLSVHHKSFTEFLLDKQGSGEYCIDQVPSVEYSGSVVFLFFPNLLVPETTESPALDNLLQHQPLPCEDF